MESPHVRLGGKTKQPYRITTDQPVISFAGLWDRSEAEDGTAVESCAIITLPASGLMAEIHNAKKRDPAMLAAGDVDAWLDGSPDEVRGRTRMTGCERIRWACA